MDGIVLARLVQTDAMGEGGQNFLWHRSLHLRFFRWQRFTGQCGLLHIEIGCLDQTCIGRHQLPCCKTDDITRHQLAAWQFQPGAIAEHARCGGDIRA